MLRRMRNPVENLKILDYELSGSSVVVSGFGYGFEEVFGSSLMVSGFGSGLKELFGSFV